MFFKANSRRPASASCNSRRRRANHKAPFRTHHVELLERRELMAADFRSPPEAVIESLPDGGQRHAVIVQLVDRDQELPGDLAAMGESHRELIPGMWRVDATDAQALDVIMNALGQDDRVEFFEADQRLGFSAVPDDDLFSRQWGLHNTGQSGGLKDADIDAPAAWKFSVGTGRTVVAVIDTGVDWKHPDLKSRIWQNDLEAAGRPGFDDDGNGYIDDVRGWDFADWDNNPMDLNGHGTHVAGIIGAKGDNDRGIAGVNWKAQIMPLRFLDENGYGYTSDAISAIEYAVANGATISNNSWGGAGYSFALYSAINYARVNDHIFVVAAGNSGARLDQNPEYPASYGQWLDNVVVVGATNRYDELAAFSNYGQGVDIAAPGSSIISTYLRNAGIADAKGYKSFSGTSMATPFVAGAASVIRDLHPEWTYRQVIDHILGSSDHLRSLSKVIESGRRLNLGTAVRDAANAFPGSRSMAQQSLDTIAFSENAVPPASAHDVSRGLVRTMGFAEEGEPGETLVADTNVGYCEVDTEGRAPAVGSDDATYGPDKSSLELVHSEVNDAIPLAAKYKVTVKGRVNGKSFEVAGFLEVKGIINPVTLNDVNPRDVFLKIGDPLVKPKAGALWLATNNAFFDRFGFIPASKKTDLAKVDMNSSARTLRTRIVDDLVSDGLNRFNDRGGLLAPMFSVIKGGLDLKFSKDGRSIKGELNVKGVAHYVPGLPSSSIQYQATIVGKLIK